MSNLRLFNYSFNFFYEFKKGLKNPVELAITNSLNSTLIFLTYCLIKNASNIRLGVNNHAALIFFRNFDSWACEKFYVNIISKGKKNFSKKNFILPQTDLPHLNYQKQRIGILNYGLDLHKFFSNKDLKKFKNINAILRWGNEKKSKDVHYYSTSIVFFSYVFYRNFILSLFVIIKFYLYLQKNTETNLSIFGLLRFTLYPCFALSRIGALIDCMRKKSNINTFLFSDISNVYSSSFMAWSDYYKCYTIVHSHGGSMDLNGYLPHYPNFYYVSTAYLRRLLNSVCSENTIIYKEKYQFDPRYSFKKNIGKPKIIAFVTGMELNKNTPIGDKNKILKYLEKLINLTKKYQITLIIKSHKLLDWHDDYEKLASEHNHVQHVKARWKPNDLLDIDLAICASTETKLFLDFLLKGRTTLVCSSLIPDIKKIYHFNPTFSTSCKSLDQLIDLLEKYITNRPYRININNNSRKMLKEILL
jgi:hypothetical protein